MCHYAWVSVGVIVEAVPYVSVRWFVMKIGHGRDVLYKPTRIGVDIFEKVMELVDGWRDIDTIRESMNR